MPDPVKSGNSRASPPVATVPHAAVVASLPPRQPCRCLPHLHAAAMSRITVHQSIPMTLCRYCSQRHFVGTVCSGIRRAHTNLDAELRRLQNAWPPHVVQHAYRTQKACSSGIQPRPPSPSQQSLSIQTCLPSRLCTHHQVPPSCDGAVSYLEALRLPIPISSP